MNVEKEAKRIAELALDLGIVELNPKKTGKSRFVMTRKFDEMAMAWIEHATVIPQPV
jgi:hypothetical protein